MKSFLLFVGLVFASFPLLADDDFVSLKAEVGDLVELKIDVPANAKIIWKIKPISYTHRVYEGKRVFVLAAGERNSKGELITDIEVSCFSVTADDFTSIDYAIHVGGSLPVPVPPVPPIPVPAPTPVPITAKRLAIVTIDHASARTQAQGLLLGDKQFWDTLRAKGHIIENLSAMDAVSAMKFKSQTDAVGLPALILMDAETGRVLDKLRIPSDKSGVQSLVDKYAK